MAIVGAVVLFVLGILYLTKDGKRKKTEQSQLSAPWYHFFTNGFILNFVNPFVVAV